MIVLLDTHFLIWLLEAPDRLTASERGSISDGIVVSAVSMWEIAVKWDSRDRHGRRKGTIDPAQALTFAVRNDIEVAALTGEIASASLRVAITHADPFDRMLLTHAQQLGTKLLTRDRQLLNHPLAYQP